MELNRELGNLTRIVGDFNVSLLVIDNLKNSLSHRDLMDIYWILHPRRVCKHFFFSSPHGMFSRIDHLLGYKTSHNSKGLKLFKVYSVIKIRRY